MNNKLVNHFSRTLIILPMMLLLLFFCNTTSYAASNKNLEKPQITDITKANDSITVNWTSIEGVDGYKIYTSENKAKYKCIATIEDPSTTSYKIKGLTSGTKYKLKIKAYIKNGKKYTFSSSSPAKRTKTEYGLSKGHFSCRKYSINWNTSIWKSGEADAKWGCNIALHTKERSIWDRAYFYISTIETYEKLKRKSFDKKVSSFIKNDNENFHTHKFKRLANRKINGKTYAVLHATDPRWGKNNETLICQSGDDLLEIHCSVYDNCANPEAKMHQLKNLLPAIRVK
ncbi:fibronectin type III domain-containing protein [Butyrivibrio sp. JL13D10]|uniref:fibronectin type III domain-containing protein n=1 Tax=Butyrivibrio sp. JL13D10 TaxID=3236815 RepID=UPI0038B5D729